MSSCVLCRNKIVKNTDKNLVDVRKNTVSNVREEILSLDIAVVINSAHICRACLSLLKKRRAVLTNIQEVNAKIRNIINWNSLPLPVKVSSTSCSTLLESSDFQEQAAKRFALEDFHAFDKQDEVSRISVEQSPQLLASTPCKEKGHDVVFPVLPISPIAARLVDEAEKHFSCSGNNEGILKTSQTRSIAHRKLVTLKAILKIESSGYVNHRIFGSGNR